MVQVLVRALPAFVLVSECTLPTLVFLGGDVLFGGGATAVERWQQARLERGRRVMHERGVQVTCGRGVVQLADVISGYRESFSPF